MIHYYPNDIVVFMDASHDINSITGLLAMMNGGPVFWLCRYQKTQSSSTSGSEIIAIHEGSKEVIHAKAFVEEVKIRPLNCPINIYEDNNAAIANAHRLKGSKGLKHERIKIAFIQHHVLIGTFEFSRIDTENQLADFLTKLLAKIAFLGHQSKVLKEPSLFALNIEK